MNKNLEFASAELLGLVNKKEISLIGVEDVTFAVE
jgi:hypothetical protein